METGNRLESNEGWGNPGTAEWSRLQTLMELVRREHRRMELSPQRRDKIRNRILERIERIERRRRTVRALVATLGTVLVAGLLLALVNRARAWVREQFAALGPI